MILEGVHDAPAGPDVVDTYECDDCGAGVGWCLTEVQDTYDSGYEAPEWFFVFVSEFGVMLYEDCFGHWAP